MKKSHLSALPLALMLLFGWSCSHSKTPKQPAEKTAFPIVMLRIVIGLQLMWIHCRTSDVTTLPWPGKNACCRFTPQIMPANRSVNLLSGFSRPKAGSLIWKQPAKWFLGFWRQMGFENRTCFHFSRRFGPGNRASLSWRPRPSSSSAGTGYKTAQHTANGYVPLKWHYKKTAPNLIPGGFLFVLYPYEKGLMWAKPDPFQFPASAEAGRSKRRGLPFVY